MYIAEKHNESANRKHVPQKTAIIDTHGPQSVLYLNSCQDIRQRISVITHHLFQDCGSIARRGLSSATWKKQMKKPCFQSQKKKTI